MGIEAENQSDIPTCHSSEKKLHAPTITYPNIMCH